MCFGGERRLGVRLRRAGCHGKGQRKEKCMSRKNNRGAWAVREGRETRPLPPFPSASSNWADEKLLCFLTGPQTLLNSKYWQNSRSISYFVTYVDLGDGQKTVFGKAMKKVRGAESWKRSVDARSCRTLFLDLIPFSAPPPSPPPKKDIKERLTQCRLVSEARFPFDATDTPQMTRMSKSKKQFPEITFVYFLAHL